MLTQQTSFTVLRLHIIFHTSTATFRQFARRFFTRPSCYNELYFSTGWLYNTEVGLVTLSGWRQVEGTVCAMYQTTCLRETATRGKHFQATRCIPFLCLLCNLVLLFPRLLYSRASLPVFVPAHTKINVRTVTGREGNYNIPVDTLQ